jgi:pimeloyl-ACP methyl ester carboxylesterase
MSVERLAMGAPIGLSTAGEGEPLVLLHGFPHDRSLWAPQLAAPPHGTKLFAPDLPGFGESARLDAPSLDVWADWLAALLDHLALDRVTLGGLSMGGYLCFAFWRRHPGRVRALVLADTKAGADDAGGRRKRGEMQALVRQQGAGAVAEQMITGMVGRTTREERPAVVETLDAMMRRASPAAIEDALDVLKDRPDSTSTLATIRVPTLIICGEEDALTPVAESRAMHSAIAGSALGTIPRAGHASNLEDPDAFDRLLTGFVSATIRR